MTFFRKCIYGPNLIDVPVKPYMQLFFEEVRFKKKKEKTLHSHCFVHVSVFGVFG